MGAHCTRILFTNLSNVFNSMLQISLWRYIAEGVEINLLEILGKISEQIDKHKLGPGKLGKDRTRRNHVKHCQRRASFTCG